MAVMCVIKEQLEEEAQPFPACPELELLRSLSLMLRILNLGLVVLYICKLLLC